MALNSPSLQLHLESSGADACAIQPYGLPTLNVLQIIESTSQEQMYCGVAFVAGYVSCVPCKGRQEGRREAGFQRRLEDDFESAFSGIQVPKPPWVFEK